MSVIYKSLDFLGYPKYKVGDDGSLWSAYKTGDWMELSPGITSKLGHKSIRLYGDGYDKAFGLHSLVLMAFVGPRPKGYFARHKDGNARDNRLCNLYWATPRQNSMDMLVHNGRNIKVLSKSEKPKDEYLGTIAQKKLEDEYGKVEVWKDLKGYEGIYQVSNWGNAKSFSRTRDHQGGTYHIPGGMLSHKGKNYKTVELRKNGQMEQRGLHVLVLETFVGPRPKGLIACHCDGNRSNNGLENLRWDTPQNNQLDRRKHDTSYCGERNNNSKTTSSQVKMIMELWKTGIDNKSEIGRIVGVSKHVVYNVTNGHAWKHITNLGQ